MKMKTKVWLEEESGLVFGTGKAMILSSIKDTGSIARAAKELNMSYRHAWSYIKSAEKRLKRPLIKCIRGGRDKGGAALTDYAEDLLRKFTKLEEKVKVYADRLYREIF